MTRGGRRKRPTATVMVASGVVVLVALLGLGVYALLELRHPDIVVGAPVGAATATSGPSIILPPDTAPTTTAPRGGGDDGDSFVDGSGALGQPGAEPRAAA